mmetsp:Transcript_10588/g.18573  ORF Transcript_10588/g.18573 Transcript_10588/m.18573 type:complete len:94 (-) Transcript_10588:559-840(-)
MRATSPAQREGKDRRSTAEISVPGGGGYGDVRNPGQCAGGSEKWWYSTCTQSTHLAQPAPLCPCASGQLQRCFASDADCLRYMQQLVRRSSGQ